MLVRADQTPSPEADDGRDHAEPPAFVPPWGEAEFDELVEGMVADEAPRLFAVVQVYGERFDGRIAAWGMAFKDHAEVVDVDGDLCLSLRSPDSAVRRFRTRPEITARLVWVRFGEAGSPDEIDAARSGTR